MVASSTPLCAGPRPEVRLSPAVLRILFRVLLAHPILLFSLSAIVVVGLAIAAFAWSERRARLMAELAEDDEMASTQRKRLTVIGLLTLAALGLAAWLIFVREPTVDHKLAVDIAIDFDDGGEALHWWDEDPGATALARHLNVELDKVGLEPVPVDEATLSAFEGVGDDEEAALAAARSVEARWLLRGRVRVDKAIELQLADFSDYITSVELELVDTVTGERFEVPGTPMRAFLWGKDPSAAVALNAEYLADRLAMPVVAAVGPREPLQKYAGDRASMTHDDVMLATALEPLFLRSENYQNGLERRRKDEEEAREREEEDQGRAEHRRIGGVLDEEYFIGTAADGRAILLSEPKHVSVSPDRIGYEITSEGEALVLVDADAELEAEGAMPARELLFEHYNFYSAPEVSANGEVVWTTVANHGASKSLATIDVASGTFHPILTHESHYYTSPLPAPDGSRALFYSRPRRRAPSSIELVERDGSGRKLLVDAAEPAGQPAWSPDGKSVYMPLGGWQRIVAIDVDSGERRHVLGQDPAAGLAEDERPANQPLELEGADLRGQRPPPQDGEAGEDGEEPEPLPPEQSSRFRRVNVNYDGTSLWVVEQDLQGRDFIGRYDLEDHSYTRIAHLEARWIEASPTADRLAVQVPRFTSPGDPRAGDSEIVVLGPAPGQVQAVTLNSHDDELGGWSRDGAAVFTIQRHKDPVSERQPAVRVYRHELGEPPPAPVPPPAPEGEDAGEDEEGDEEDSTRRKGAGSAHGGAF